MGVTQLYMTSPRWSVSTATRWDILQGNTKVLGTKIAGTGIKTALEGLFEVPTNRLYGTFRLWAKSELEKLKQEKESNQLKIENFDNASKSLDKLIGSQITDKSRKGVGFVSYNVVPPPPTGLFSPPKFDLSNSGLEEFQQPEFEGYGPKTSKSVSEDISNEVRESPDAPLVKELVSDDKLEKKIVFPTVAKIEFVRPKQQEKPVRKPVKYAEMYRSQSPRGNQRNWNNQKSQQLGSDFVMYNKACFVCGSFDHVQADYNYHQRERVVSGNNYTRVNYNYSAKKAHPSAHRNMVPRAVLMKTGLRSLNTARPVNTAHPKTTVYSARPMSRFSKSAQSTVKRPYQIRTTLTNKNFSQKVNTAKGKFYTARPKAVNTARPNSAVVNAVRANQVNAVKASACWVWRPTKLNSASITLKRHNYGHPQKEDQGYVDSGCSRHMTGNMSYLSDFKEFDGGYELQFNLFSASQICDKKNNVFFTDTGCFVLSPDFKLSDESQAEAVNTACYVQNRVLVVKLNQDSLRTCKFDGKSDEGFFVGYSMNSKAFRVYNIRTRKVEENLHIRFLEDKPIIAGDGPKWLFDIDVLTKSMNYVPVVAGTNSNDLVGTEESIGACHSSKETGSSQDYILMPLWKDGSLFDSSLKNASNDEPQPSSDAEKKDDEGVNKESGIDDQERPENSTQDVNTARPSINIASTNVNTGSLNINIVSPTVTTAPLEATHADFFGDETEVDMSNITTTYLVPSTPNTRIHKDHSLDHVIGDVQSGVQTRRMTKTTNEQGFISVVYKGKTHEDLHTCLFACFLSQEEPKKVIQALKDIQLDKLCRELSAVKLQQQRFHKGQIDKTLFIKRVKSDILLVQVYVDDIIFGSTKKELCTEFKKLMHKKFQMSSMGELTFFLGLQVTQKDDGIFISQDKYVDEILKKFGFSTVKTASTPMETLKPLMKDENAEDVNVHYKIKIGVIDVLTSSRPNFL
ncbi:putative ribonuclease H-like domain-containing protein [Tanacetum coccineum]|uniref:Ribonuclease H-like domain-containing protein n=1 Tax=Tanacetum coccineum TaxID=301880 RepID=A0ABQ5BDL4_9ASTR